MSNTSKYALAIAMLLGAAQAQAAKYTYTYTDLGSMDDSIALGINSRGDVVGSMADYYIQVFYGYKDGIPTVWSGGKQTVLDTQHIGSANAINDAGVIAGTISVGSSSHAAVFANGKVTDLGAQSGFTGTSYANAINNSGQVAGSAAVGVTPAGYPDRHAISWDKNGKATDLSTLSGPALTYSTANGINNKGDAVGIGYVNEATYEQGRPVLWSNGQVNVLSDTRGIAYAVNDHGQVVGERNVNAGMHATLWQNGKTVDLGALTSDGLSSASAINNRGDVVGWANTLYAGQHAVLWSNGQAIDLNDFSPSPNWVIQSATGINDKGVIVGYAQDLTDWAAAQPRVRAFMLTPVAPVPEADTYAMMAGGFALFGLLRRRAKTRQLT